MVPMDYPECPIRTLLWAFAPADAAPVTTIDADWRAQAACRDADPEEHFVVGAAQKQVKVRCVTCAVRTECLADALDGRVEFGVWGGMTERERRALLRRRPEVRDWRALLLSARGAAAAR